MNSKALITSTAARIVGSETGPTVMTNDTRSFGQMGFLLQRIDIDVVTGDDFGCASYDTALIFHGEA